MTLLRNKPARRASLVSAACIALITCSASGAAAQTSVVDIAQAAAPAVVNVSVFFGGTPGDFSGDAVRVQRPGSGVVLTKTGLVLTNSHLVEEVTEADGSVSEKFWAMVSFRRGSSFTAKVVARDERLDLALLQINAGSESLTAMPLASMENRHEGERVLAMSLASVRDAEIFAGVLAFPGGQVKLREALLEPAEVLLTDARFHDSLDGGPLLDARGRLLGLYNSSHVSDRPEGFDDDEEDEHAEKEPSRDYAVIVNAHAVRNAFDEFLSADALPTVRVTEEPIQEAVRPIEVIAPHVASVWTGAAEEHPTVPDVSDPPARLVPDTLGSGVIIDSRGLLLTNNGLFANGADSASVRLADGRVFQAKLLKREPVRQVALLALELPEGESVPAAVLTDSTQAVAGELTAVVGRPYTGSTLSVGVLSSLDRENYLQVASWVHAGHFGGAIADRNGHLIGIAVKAPVTAGRADEKSFLGFVAPLAEALESFKTELEPYGELTVLHEDEAGLEARHSVAVHVRDTTYSSLVNVLVSLTAEKKNSGFDPFGDDEKEFFLRGQGSGVVIDASGLALTNWHVVDAAMKSDGSQSDDALVEVTMPGGKRYVADVLSTSRDDDLALIAMRLDPGEKLVPIVLGDSDALVVGQPVFAIGNPLGLANSVSAGVVSCLNMDIMIRGRLHKYLGMIQTDAAINPGNSGGALLDAEGRLVGINSAGRTGAGMAITVNRAREVFSGKLLSVEKLHSIYMGFTVKDTPAGVVIEEIDDDSPATAASLEVGDLIQSFAGVEIQSAIHFAQVRLEVSPDASVVLGLARYGEEHLVDIIPQSYTAWRIAKQSGLELQEVDYAAEADLIREASIALYRAYTGNEQGQPREFMEGALRVESANSIELDERNPVLPGDLLLGMTTRIRGLTSDQYNLTRFESLEGARKALDPIATKEGTRRECWVLRNGECIPVTVLFRRPRR